MTQGRPAGKPRKLDWDAILDRWAAGAKLHAIADALGYPAGSVSRVVHRGREAGDPRAVRRYGAEARRTANGDFIGPYWLDPRQLPLFPDAEAEAS